MTGGGFIAGSIVGKLLLDKTGWNQSIAAVSKETKDMGGQLKDLGDKVSGLAKTFAAIGVAAAAAFAVALKKTADLGDQFYDLSQKTGISTEMLSGYKLAADKSGASVEQFAIGMRGLSRVMGEASQGGKEAREVFSRLGVQYTDNAGKVRPLNDVMLDLADRFSKMPDGAEKASLAMQAFGRSGMELIPMLNLGREGLEANYEATKRLGGLWSAEAARAADAFNDSLAELKLSLSSVLKDGLVVIMPVVQKFVEAVTTGIAKIREQITALAESGKIQTWAVEVARVIIGAFKLIVQAVGGLVESFYFLQGVVFSIGEAIVKEVLRWYTYVAGSVDALSRVVPGLKGVAEKMAGAWRDLVIVGMSYNKTAGENYDKTADMVSVFETLNTFLNNLSASFDKMGTEGERGTNKLGTSTRHLADRMRDLSKEVKALALIELPDLNLEIKETAGIFDKWLKTPPAESGLIITLKEVDVWAERALNDAKIKARTKIWTQRWDDTAMAIIATMSQAFGVIDQLSQASFNRRFTELDTWYEKQKAVIEGSMMGEANKATALLALDKEYNEKRKAIQREQAQQQKALAITQAVINTAEAVTKALTGAIPPFNYILAAISAAMGAVQIALIRAQPIPLAKGAIFKQPAFLESIRTGQRYEVGEGGEAEILSSVSKLREAIFGRGGAGVGRAVSLTVPIYIGAKKVEEHVIRIVEDASAIGRLRIQAKSIA